MSGKTFISWSGGKDSSLAFYKASKQGVKIEALLTSVNAVHNRVSMHGVRRELLEAQATALGLPLYTIELPEQPSMTEYETEMRKALQRLKAGGFTQGIYGDIFLEDLKRYREEGLAIEGLAGIFPLWKGDSQALMQEFIETGFKAITVCVNGSRLHASFCGRLLDESFVSDLPAGIDPCGENGEYHSFVFDGPVFKQPIAIQKGEAVYREYASPQAVSNDDCFTAPQPTTGFWFCDLLPVG